MAKFTKQIQNFPSIINTIWYIGFTETRGPIKWWDWFTKEGFRHVYMYTLINPTTWLCVQMNRGGLVMTTIEVDALKHVDIHKYLKELWGGNKVLAARGAVHTATPIPRRAPFTCVELARSLLGIDKMLYTPFQLYNYIIDNRLAVHEQRAI